MVILSKNVVDNGCSTNDGEAGVSGNDQQSCRYQRSERQVVRVLANGNSCEKAYERGNDVPRKLRPLGMAPKARLLGVPE